MFQCVSLCHVLGMCWLQQAVCWQTGLSLLSPFGALTADTGGWHYRINRFQPRMSFFTKESLFGCLFVGESFKKLYHELGINL